MGGPLTNQQKSKEFYRFAYACEEQSKRCDHQCPTCSLNVHLYVDDPREATLIKTSARLDYSRRTPDPDGPLSMFVSFLTYVAMIGGIIFGIRACCSCASYDSSTAQVQQTQTKESWATAWARGSAEVEQNLVNNLFALQQRQQQPAAVQPIPQQPATIAEKTYSTAVYTHNHVYDVNNDRLVDCIDYAVVFYENYPDKGDCKLMWICPTNPRNDTHMYVRVGAYDIEPQETSQTFDKRLLRNVWGKRFDYGNTKDITYAYTAIKNNTFRWIWQ